MSGRRLTLAQRRHIAAKLIAMERASNGGRPAWRWLRRGFFSARAALYPFDLFDPDLFLSDYELEFRAIGLNEPAARKILADKLLMHGLVQAGAIPVRMPQLAGLVLCGRFIPLEDDGEPGGPLIVKPLDGSGGVGVHRIDGLKALEPTGTCLVERAVDPHRYAAAIFPNALNTIRVMTGQDDDGVFVIGAVHRFGTARSAPTDNFKRGGLSAMVALATGELSMAAALPQDGRRRSFAAHPETGAAICGVTVPGWEEVRQAALACASLPGLRFAGWDLAITEDGVVLIEGNGEMPNPNLYQAHRPLLIDDRTRALFCDLGVVTPRHRARLDALR